jgi:hypothetical protein
VWGCLKNIFFTARGATTGLSLPAWSINDHPTNKSGTNINGALNLISLQSLLSFGEHHLIFNLKYIQTIIGGTFFRRAGTAKYDMYHQR